jgi:RNA polymerase sigma-32 factor
MIFSIEGGMVSLPVLRDSLSSYLVEVNRFPVLSRDEEYRLALRWHEGKDIEAAHALVTSNLRFVVSIALEYRNYGVPVKDLVQEGNIGLMTAVKKFDPHRGMRLITYAVWWIRAFIQEHIIKTVGIVKTSAKAVKRRLFYRGKKGIDSRGEDPLSALSLDAPINGEEGKSHLEGLADSAAAPEEAFAEREENALIKKNVRRALCVLNEKERLVIERRILAEEPQTLEAIATALGLSRERVRQIEGSALGKLRKFLAKSAPPTPALTAGE